MLWPASPLRLSAIAAHDAISANYQRRVSWPHSGHGRYRRASTRLCFKSRLIVERWTPSRSARTVWSPQVDTIVLDAMVPIRDSWEFLALWRTRPVDQRAPVLVVSAVRDWRKALDSGVQGYLSKAFAMDTLESMLASVLCAA